MTNEQDSTSLDGAGNCEEDGGAMSNSKTNSRIKVGIQTPGGLPDWLVHATVEDLTSPVMKREAPIPMGSKRT